MPADGNPAPRCAMKLERLEPKRILVLALKHIGDVLVIVPTLRALKRRWPAARLELLAASGMADLVRGLPFLDEVLEFDRAALRGAPGAEWRFAASLRARRYDLTVDLTGGERSAWYAFLSGAPIRVGADDARGFPGRRLLFHALTPWGAGHYVENHLAIVAPLGVTAAGDDLKMAIAIPAAAVAGADAKLAAVRDPFAVVHPTSRWMFKSWPAASCAAVINGLQARGFAVVLTTGPDAKERERGAEITAAVTSRARLHDLGGQLTLPELARVTNRARLFLGVDSAPMHIASAVGTPTVVLFGPSGAHNWGPWRVPHRVITGDRDHGPCGRDGCDGTKRSRCLEAITDGTILTAADELLIELTETGCPLPMPRREPARREGHPR